MRRGNLPLALVLFEEVLAFKMLHMGDDILSVTETDTRYVLLFSWLIGV